MRTLRYLHFLVASLVAFPAALVGLAALRQARRLQQKEELIR